MNIFRKQSTNRVHLVHKNTNTLVHSPRTICTDPLQVFGSSADSTRLNNRTKPIQTGTIRLLHALPSTRPQKVWRLHRRTTKAIKAVPAVTDLKEIFFCLNLSQMTPNQLKRIDLLKTIAYDHSADKFNSRTNKQKIRFCTRKRSAHSVNSFRVLSLLIILISRITGTFGADVQKEKRKMLSF